MLSRFLTGAEQRRFSIYASRLLCAALVCAFFQAQTQAVPTPNPPVEYQVKASLVFNFMHFIEWPADAFRSNAQINVCLVGRDIYGNALRVLEGEVVQGKNLAVRTQGAWSPEFANSCHIVIFSKLDREAVRQALATLGNKSVLTVGETPGFLEDGGIIKFTIINDTVQFEVNLEAAKLARLNISSKLLRLASSVVTASRAGGQ